MKRSVLFERLQRIREPGDRWLRTTSRLLLASGSTATAGGSLVLKTRWAGRSDSDRARDVQSWAKSILRILGVRLRLGSDDVPVSKCNETGGPTLVVANHRSILDIPVLLSLTGGHMLSRGDVADWPLFGKMAELAGTIYVDRDDAQSGALAIQRMTHRLRRDCTVCVFPEGTTFPGDWVRPFRPGAFIAAARTHGTIAPMGVAYADDSAIYGDESLWSHVARLAGARETRVAVVIGRPFASRGLGVHELCKQSHQHVQELVRKARQLLW